jgi:hypothetical protein
MIGRGVSRREAVMQKALGQFSVRTRLRHDCHDFEEPERISQKTALAALIKKESPIGAKRNRQVEKEDNRSGRWNGYGPKE